MSRTIARLEDGGECPRPSCSLPLVTITYKDGNTITVHDDGSWDDHPAWSPST